MLLTMQVFRTKDSNDSIDTDEKVRTIANPKIQSHCIQEWLAR